MLVLLLLLATVWLAIQFSPIQTWLVRQVSQKLSADLHTEVQVKRVDFSLFKRVVLEGVLVRDRSNDTLLYAGRLSARVNNWFFLKNKLVVSNLSLEHTTVLLQRTDSVWNYQFLIDYFAAPSGGGTQSNNLEVQLKRLRLQQVRFRQIDRWFGQNMEIAVGSLLLDANRISLLEKKIDVNKIFIDAPLVALSNYKGNEPTPPLLDDDVYHRRYDSIPPAPLLPGWIIKAGSLQIADGTFRNDAATNREPYPYFDGEHLHFYDIQAGFGPIQLTGDTLQSRMTLRLKERSGLEVQKMNALLQWHGRGIEFSELDLQTPKSRLRDYFAMRYLHFNHDMNRFVSHVIMEGRFVKSTIHSDDLALFAPELKNMNDVVQLSGRARGTLNHLKGEEIVITTGSSTKLAGRFTIDGLPNINNTFLDINATTFSTNYNDALQIYPELRKIKYPALNKLGRVDFTGSFTGYINDFVTYGTLRTNLGTVITDINLKLPARSAPIYSGKLRTRNFNIGSFLNEPLLGSIEMEGTIRGKGFTDKQLYAELDARIGQMELNGYNYRNIEARGIAEKKKFDGTLVVHDENLNLNLTGMVDAGSDTVAFRVNGRVHALHTKELHLWKKDLRFSGDIDGNFRIRRIEDFIGTAIIQNAQLLYNGERLPFDSLYVQNKFTDSVNKQLVMRSNELSVELNGDYNLVYIPKMAQFYLANYFPAYIKKPQLPNNQQAFDFNVETGDITPFLHLFDVPLRGFDQSTITGTFNTGNSTFDLNVRVPSFELGSVLFEDVVIGGRSNTQQLNLNGSIFNIRFNDSLSLPQTVFTASAANDTGRITINTSASHTLKDANLNARFKASNEGFTVTFEPSSIMLSEKTWRIERESDFFIGNNTIFSNGLRLTSGLEEIFAYTHPSDIGNYNDLVVELRKVQLGDLIPYVLTDPRIEGSATGRVDIMNPLGKMQADYRLTIDRFRFNNDSIGIVSLRGNYSSTTGDINYAIESDNRNHEFTITGKTNILNPDSVTTDNLINLKNESLSIISPYLSLILTDIKGTGSGTIRVVGDGQRPELIGSVRLNNASFVLDYTRCRYWVNNGTVINFREGTIDFGTIKLCDSSNRTATFSGRLFHRFFNDMSFDLNFRTDDDNKGLLVLNTTKRDNDLFYGQVVARASGSITGPQNDIQIRLRGAPTDSSRLYLLTSDSKVTGTADFIVFRKYGTLMQIETEIKESSALTVDLDVTANPFARIYLILDEFTNDIIEGQGNGAINLRVGTNERTTMSGNFTITSGRYKFNWQSLFKKPFLINSGTINWSGDPYDARINIDANYLVERVSLPPELASGCTDSRNDLLVVANLSNTLKNPEIKFRFELPQSHPCRNNPLTISGFNQLYNNPDELNRQVISLLLVGSFITTNPASGVASGNLGNTLFSNVAGTLSEFIAQQVSSGLDAVLRNIPGIKDLELDPYVTFTPGLISGTQAQGMGFQGTGTFGFTRRLLNGRILLKAGGSVLVNAGQMATVQNNNQITPDLSIEWLLTPDGKLRLIGFYRTVFDIQRRNDRTGVSFSYVREFDKIW
ncbi:MAG: translocation/assembly module TamB domain-containing protein [Lacibacter sp.]